METKSRVNISYYIVVVMLLLVRILIGEIAESVSSNQVDIIFTVLTQIAIMFAIPVISYFLIIKPKASIKDFSDDFGFKRFKKGEIWKVLLLGFIAIFLNTVFAQINFGFLDLIGFKRVHSALNDYVNNIGLFFLDIFMTAMLPALCEETAHRGLFRVSYKDKPVKYILLSSLLFSLMHQNIQQSIYTFFTGILFSSAVVFTGNLWTSVIMHFMINFVEVLSTFGMQYNVSIFLLKDYTFAFLTISPLTQILLAILTLVGIYLFIRVLYSFRSRDKFKLEKVRRMFLDGTLTYGYMPSLKASTAANIFMCAIIVTGLTMEIYTLIWGLIR